MDKQEVKAFVETYFKLQDCRFIEQNDVSLTVELNPETDRDLHYRPFYWSYIDNIGIKPELLQKTYIFDHSKSEQNGEFILFGSSRLHQIFAATKKRGRFVRLYEDRSITKGTNSLYPWILVNYKIEYVSDQKQEKIISIGFNLVTGEIRDQFHRLVEKIPLTPKIPAYLFVQSPIYSLNAAIANMEAFIRDQLKSEENSWAMRATEQFEFEKEQTIRYYDELLTQYSQKNGRRKIEQQVLLKWEMEKKKRMEELAWQYLPRIEINTINQGIFYLRTHPSQMSNVDYTPALYV